MSWILWGVIMITCGMFTIKRPDTRWFGGFGDPYATDKRLWFTRLHGILTLIAGVFLIVYALCKTLFSTA